MMCNKCGTPILPGEHICRGCGNICDLNNDKYDDVEIIDFVEPEVIDFTTGEDEVSINSNNDVNNAANNSPAVTPMTAAPLEATGVLKKVEYPKDNVVIENSSMPSNPLASDNRSPLSDATAYVVTSPETKGKDEAVSLDNDKKEDKKEEIKEDKVIEEVSKFNENDGSKSRLVGLILLLILLILSVVLNVYLLITEPQCDKTVETPVINETLQSVYYDGYKLEFPSNWITETDEDRNNIVLMDNTEEWAVSITIKAGVDAKSLVANKDKITDSFGKSKYLFTSDYVADATDDTFHVFKGKYYNYITYVVTRTINSTTLAIGDLKFKGEVDEEVYNKVVDVLKTITKLDTDSLYDNNFEFKDISSIFADNLKVVSSGD